MQTEDVTRVLSDPLAQELMQSSIPARLAYLGLDGFPRAIPIGFHWNGVQFVLCTVPHAPKVPALKTNPKVAFTVDTRATARTMMPAARSADMTSQAGACRRVSGWWMPRLTTWWISESTKPGLINVTDTPSRASSPSRAWASARPENLLMAEAERPGKP